MAKTDKIDKKTVKAAADNSMANFAFVVAYIGALVYFVQQSEGFWGFIAAILKSLIWPALVLHRALELLRL